MDGRLDMSLRALESSTIVLSEKYRVHGVIFTRNIRNIDLMNIEFQEIRNKRYRNSGKSRTYVGKRECTLQPNTNSH